MPRYTFVAEMFEYSEFFHNPTAFKFNIHKTNSEGLYVALSEVDWTFFEDLDNMNAACNNLYTVLYDILVNMFLKNRCHREIPVIQLGSQSLSLN